MVERKSMTAATEPRGELYRSLVNSALVRCDSFYFVLLEDQAYGEDAARLRSSLSQHLLSSDRVTEWPGTRLLGKTGATMERYALNDESAAVLSSAADGLYDWTAPYLPDDLGFLRPDGSTWLASVAHEKDAWLELDEADMQSLLDVSPGLYDIFQSAFLIPPSS